MALGQKVQEERDSAQVSLFGTEEIVKVNGNGRGKFPDIQEWDDKLKLGFEKESLGFFITGHPLDRYALDMKRFTTADTAAIAELDDGREVRICGIVSAIKETITKKGDRMAYVTLEDMLGTIELLVFPELFSRSGHLLSTDEPLVVTGTLDVGEKSTKIKASDIVLLVELTARGTSRVHFDLRSPGLDRSQLEALKDIIARHSGKCDTLLHIVIPDNCRATIPLPGNFRVSASDDLAVDVEKLVGYRATRFE
jgi:DNA polymerase-3 subunit alpha